jgi:hypothetical protein
MAKFAIFMAALLGVAWSAAAQAGTITVYTDRSLYDAAVAAAPSLQTQSVSLSPFTNPTELNMTSSSGLHPLNVTSIGGEAYLSNQQNVITDTLHMAPAADVRALGFDYFVGNPGALAGTVTGLVSVNGTLEASTTNSGNSPLTAVAFFGMISDSPIASIVYARIATGSFTPNQIEFIKSISFATATTPLPAALPLFISALGGIGFVGWRRKRAAA